MSGIKFFLKNMNVDVSELDNNPIVKMVKAGMQKTWRALPGNSKSDRQTLPFSADMVVGIRNEYLHYKSPSIQTKLELALSTAMAFGFILLVRVSEYIMTDSNHFIRGKHVIFIMRDANGIHFPIDSSQAHLYEISNLIETIVTIKDAKNDPDGNGHRFNYQVQSATSCSIICIASDLFRCASTLRPLYDSAFFAFRGDHTEGAWFLSEYTLNSMLKKGAGSPLFGFDEKRFSSHSLRIGGASALAAAGAPSWVIQLTGRWKSLAFLQYIRLASTQFQRSIELQTDGKTFTAKHIAMWNPAHAVIQPAVVAF